MNKPAKLEFILGELCREKYADPPEDTLGELSHFEMGLRLFCYECDRPVTIKIGEEVIRACFDVDICILLEDNLPEQVSQLARGKKIQLDFPEIMTVIRLEPEGDKISCTWIAFGDVSERKHFELEKNQVVRALRQFVETLIEMAVNGGYITQEEKEEFLKPMLEGAGREAIA